MLILKSARCPSAPFCAIPDSDRCRSGGSLLDAQDDGYTIFGNSGAAYLVGYRTHVQGRLTVSIVFSWLNPGF